MSNQIYYHRRLEPRLNQALKQFPAVVVTGGRQSGKSTMLQKAFPDYTYLNLDDPQIRLIAMQDPRLFLTAYSKPMIIDEIQYVPELLNYIKMEIDKNRHNYGQYLLTGSQMFNLMSGVSESLAGRVAVFHLYPFSVEEILDHDRVNFYDEAVLFKHFLQGFYPEHYVNKNLNSELWFASYVSTYIERDIRNIRKVSDLGQFQIFIQVLATRAGILCYFLGIDSPERLLKSPEKGRIYENFLIMEFLKAYLNRFNKAPFSFYRTANGVEVDLIIEFAGKCTGIEMKFSKTPSIKMAQNLKRLNKEQKLNKAVVLNLHQEKLPLGEGVNALHWLDGLKSTIA
ncbi:hypothetical protein B1H10_09105 [candidate division KSB1 bacterium 4484_188]|nr:MAG: hypothetical protein B1H10_09105 [candidate division KSB1 bacterium 4484_188]